ncbi:SANT associated [Dillenia turbinata]|uniref:SANT associated n=1 Tax=Dillenia turbinata TaxID=194707 RepID=A0AAN8ZS89_9MAGN
MASPPPPLLSKSHFQKTVCLNDWWLMKSKNDVNGKRLAIGGNFTSKQHAARAFCSAPIMKRYDIFTVETADGICIKFNGLINKDRTIENGFSVEVFRHFLFGFPAHWEKYAEECSNGEPSSKNNLDPTTSISEDSGNELLTKNRADAHDAKFAEDSDEVTMIDPPQDASGLSSSVDYSGIDSSECNNKGKETNDGDFKSNQMADNCEKEGPVRSPGPYVSVMGQPNQASSAEKFADVTMCKRQEILKDKGGGDDKDKNTSEIQTRSTLVLPKQPEFVVSPQSEKSSSVHHPDQYEGVEKEALEPSPLFARPKVVIALTKSDGIIHPEIENNDRTPEIYNEAVNLTPRRSVSRTKSGVDKFSHSSTSEAFKEFGVLGCSSDARKLSKREYRPSSNFLKSDRGHKNVSDLSDVGLTDAIHERMGELPDNRSGRDHSKQGSELIPNNPDLKLEDTYKNETQAARQNKNANERGPNYQSSVDNFNISVEEKASNSGQRRSSAANVKRKLKFVKQTSPQTPYGNKKASTMSAESLNFKRSRSGRLLLPTLEFWRNQIPVYNMGVDLTLKESREN